MVILSDLSEVFIRGIWGSEEYLAKKYGREAGEKSLSRYRAVNSTFQELLRGKITEDAYWREFFKCGNYPFDAADARAAFHWNLSRVIPGTLSVYKRVCAYPTTLRADQQITQPGRPRIYIVSDHVRERLAEVQSMHPDVFNIIEKCIWSCDEGKLKADDGFFAEILRRERLKPEETIFVDDIVANIGAASRAGIAGIQFQHADQLETMLKSYGFKFTPKKVEGGTKNG